MSVRMRLTHSIVADEMEKRENLRREKALSYLKAKYPGMEEEVFFTDYTGRRFGEAVHVWAAARAAEIEEICGKCRGGRCQMAEVLKGKDSRPIVCVSKSPRGYSYIDVRWTRGIACKYEPLSGEFGRMYRKSGLDAGSRKMTFQNYESDEETKTCENGSDGSLRNEKEANTSGQSRNRKDASSSVNSDKGNGGRPAGVVPSSERNA